MLSCKEVCCIVSESQDKTLPWHKRLRVNFHLFMCKACQQLARQMQLLRSVGRQYEENDDETLPTDQVTLSKEASNRIMTRLRQAEHHSTDQ
jgi:hypothetical protein